MKHGDIVEVWKQDQCRPRKTLCIALYVGRKDLLRGINARRPGIHLFRGYWYGQNPKDIQSFGKIEGRTGRVVGRVRGHYQLKSLGV